MKKLLSVILLVVMIFSTNITSFAAVEEEYIINGTTDIKILQERAMLGIDEFAQQTGIMFDVLYLLEQVIH